MIAVKPQRSGCFPFLVQALSHDKPMFKTIFFFRSYSAFQQVSDFFHKHTLPDCIYIQCVFIFHLVGLFVLLYVAETSTLLAADMRQLEVKFQRQILGIC